MERSRQAAEDVLKQLLPGVLPSVGNESAVVILTDEFVMELSEVMWTHRFEEDRKDPQKFVRQAVGDAIDRLVLEGKA
jgi:hypothetical protein